MTVEIPAAPDPAPEELVDEVKKEIAAAESKKESDYTEATWKAYDEALKKAEKAVKEGTASKEEMQKILKDLRDAASALTKKNRHRPQIRRHRLQIRILQKMIPQKLVR